MRESSQRASENTIELQHGSFIEDHRVEFVGLEAGMVQTPFDRQKWKSRIAFVAR